MAALIKLLLKSYYFKLVNKFPPFYVTRTSVLFVTKAHHLFLSRARLIESATSQPIPLRSILILSYHQHLLLPVSYYVQAFLPKCPVRYTCPTHLMLHALLAFIVSGEGYRSWKTSLCCSLQIHVISYLLDVNIFLTTLFSKSLILCSSLDMRHQISHPYKIVCNFHLLLSFHNTNISQF